MLLNYQKLFELQPWMYYKINDNRQATNHRQFIYQLTDHQPISKNHRPTHRQVFYRPKDHQPKTHQSTNRSSLDRPTTDNQPQSQPQVFHRPTDPLSILEPTQKPTILKQFQSLYL